MHIDQITQDAILRVGEVSEVNGRKTTIKVDRDKNLSDILLNGDILKNVSVSSYIEIRKGFLRIIGKVEGERIEEVYEIGRNSQTTPRVQRFLSVSLIGFIDRHNKFTTGTKELPLIGNEAFIVSREIIQVIHGFVSEEDLSISIARTEEGIDIKFPVDGLFNGHIAIFGNTGSGKSNTLAYLYQELISELESRNFPQFHQNTKFLLFDFNGEYGDMSCISSNKIVYNLSTRSVPASKLPLNKDGFFDLEFLAVLSNATEKTQKPFLRRTIDLYHREPNEEEIKKKVINQVERILRMTERQSAYALLNNMREILPKEEKKDVGDGLDWHGQKNTFFYTVDNNQKKYFSDTTGDSAGVSSNTALGKRAEKFEFTKSAIGKFIQYMYIQLTEDVLSHKAQNEHIAPVISRLKSKEADIDKIFDLTSKDSFWGDNNFVVVNLKDVNIDMKKTLPLLITKQQYARHKTVNESGRQTAVNRNALTIIIDEAHNILSQDSIREAEAWKDYRLETFEEVIKEGRKFGVFVTIASQRPNDISPTITSQMHNYFIHRLVNQKDLDMISNAVSYIDRLTEESIPTLSTGTCIFSGIASQRPLKLNIKELPDRAKPQSTTLRFADIVPELNLGEIPF